MMRIASDVVSEPFQHVVEDGLWDGSHLREVLAEFPAPNDSRWIRYTDAQREVKLEGGPEMWGAATKRLFDLMESAAPALAEKFGLPELIMRAEGGGYHNIQPGGKLAVHADFNRSDDGPYRRLNMIVYLNEDWTDADGGKLELWGRGGQEKAILPLFNRTVVFTTSDTSFHGHPVPLPGPRPRRSVATYFFTKEPGPGYDSDHSTLWAEN